MGIITGANTGIGLETAVDLAKRNARVILACRSVERGETAAIEVRKRSGNDDVVFVQLDLASLDSVRKFAAKILEEEPRIDTLINNAGVMALPERKLTQDGFEMQFGTNHLGHFLLTNLLLDRIKEALLARIINVSSSVHKMGSIDLITSILKNLTHLCMPTVLASLQIFFSLAPLLNALRAPV